MKHTLYLILLLLPFAGFSQQKTDEATQIRQLMEEQAAAWNRGDLEAFMQPYWKSDSLAFVGSNGPVYGWQATLDNYKKTYPGTEAMGTLTFRDIKVDVLSESSAFVMGGWHLQRKRGNLSGYFTLLFKKIDGEWKIVVDHSS